MSTPPSLAALPRPMPAAKLAFVLVGFPVVSTLVSLLLVDRSLALPGLDFFTTFWGLITGWYVLQVVVLGRVLKSAGWTWQDIGYGWNRRRTLAMAARYLVFAFALLGLIELALADAQPTPAQLQALSDLADLTPKTTAQRVVFIAMGLVAAICEELVYRGFAIRGLASRGLHAWLAVPLAGLPFVFQHGLKSVAQFGWFYGWALVFGVLFLATRKLHANIVVHWLVILAALPAVLQVLQ